MRFYKRFYSGQFGVASIFPGAAFLSGDFRILHSRLVNSGIFDDDQNIIYIASIIDVRGLVLNSIIKITEVIVGKDIRRSETDRKDHFCFLVVLLPSLGWIFYFPYFFSEIYMDLLEYPFQSFVFFDFYLSVSGYLIHVVVHLRKIKVGRVKVIFDVQIEDTDMIPFSQRITSNIESIIPPFFILMIIGFE